MTFWQLSVYDLTVPARTYTREMEKISAQLKIGGPRDKRLEDHLINIRDQLLKEMKEQIDNCSVTKERLRREKSQWFASGT